MTVDAVNGALAVCRHAIDAGSVDHLLQGIPVAPALREQAHPRRVGPPDDHDIRR